ncbi:hypothetical protein ACP6PL_23730 [Dapis sp. BLCC M126]|uniref:hypothetical protein n=1 Tax=Dapis sp. BLCC M126 TaxID=3400189 RepID=UPI003CF7AF76
MLELKTIPVPSCYDDTHNCPKVLPSLFPVSETVGSMINQSPNLLVSMRKSGLI